MTHRTTTNTTASKTVDLGITSEFDPGNMLNSKFAKQTLFSEPC